MGLNGGIQSQILPRVIMILLRVGQRNPGRQLEMGVGVGRAKWLRLRRQWNKQRVNSTGKWD